MNCSFIDLIMIMVCGNFPRHPDCNRSLYVMVSAIIECQRQVTSPAVKNFKSTKLI